MPPQPGRNKNSAWLRACADVRATEHVCWLCNEPIDKRLPARHRKSFSVDHVVPLYFGGEPYARHNLRAAHLGCNSARSNRIRAELKAQRDIRTSRRW